MAASVKDVSSGRSSTGNVTINKPATLADGDLLVAVAWSDDSLVNPVPPAGWTQQGTSQSQTGIGVGKVWRQVAASEPASETWTVTGGNSASIIWVLAITGFDTTTPFDISPTWTQNATASTTRTALAVSPTGTTSLLVVSFWSLPNFTVADSYTTPTGMTEHGDQGDAAGASYASSSIYSQQLSASGTTGTRVSTSTASGKWMGVTFAINSAASASSPRRLFRPF
jgi:hypothetical protein